MGQRRTLVCGPKEPAKTETKNNQRVLLGLGVGVQVPHTEKVEVRRQMWFFVKVIKHYWEGLECPCRNLGGAKVSLQSFLTLPLGFIGSKKAASAVLRVKKMSGVQAYKCPNDPVECFFLQLGRPMIQNTILTKCYRWLCKNLNSVSCYSLHAFQESSNGENASVPEAQTIRT